MGHNKMFSALLWKNYLYCRHHFILVPLQVLFPVILFYLLAYSCESLQNEQKRTDIRHPPLEEHESNDYFYKSARDIHFSPDNAVISDIISSVAKKISIESKRFIGYPDETTLMKNFDNGRIGQIVLLFQVPEDINYVSSLSYTMRVKGIDTSKIYVVPNTQEHMEFANVYATVTALQIAIDKTVIEMNINRTIDEKVSTQMFYYPELDIDYAWEQKYFSILPYTTTFAFIFGLLMILTSLISEKSSGIKELLKMMGLNNNLLWLSHYTNYLIINTVAVLIIIFIISFYGDAGLMIFSDKSILFITLILYANYVILFSFFVSTLFTRSIFGCIILSLIWYFSTMGSYRLMENTLSHAALVSLCFLPNFPIFTFFRNVGILELEKTGAQYSNIASTPGGGLLNALSILEIWTILFFNIVVFSFLTWYVDQINPGPYGIPKPWNFLFAKTRKKISFLSDNSELEEVNDLKHTVEKFSNLETYISIKQLWKVYETWGFGKTTALSDLTLDIHKGGITALLGHNGAGKTTLMSIISGMLTPTSGTIYIDGRDIRYHMDEIHSFIGFCPQENLTFPYMTVRDHLIFFAMIKGFTLKECEKECDMLLSNLNMTEKANVRSHELSGGMQRRLQLGIALTGSSKLLILDEPSSGLDPETRRELWDILLELRNTRTILLTTHSMEEADALGNRVVIVDHGKLKCYGSPMFLKAVYQTGYKLQLFKTANFNIEPTTNIIKYAVPSVIWTEDQEKVVYTLPFEHSLNFVNLFEELEAKKEELGIKSIRLLTTSLEDVFLKVTNSGANETEDLINNELDVLDEVRSKETLVVTNPVVLCSSQIRGLLKRKFYFLRYNQLFSAIIQFAVVCLFLISLFTSSSVTETPNRTLKLDLSLYSTNKLIVYINNNIDIEKIKLYMENFNAELRPSSNVTSELENIERNNPGSYGTSLIIGVDYNEAKKEYIALYSTSVMHALPVAVNFVDNLLANLLYQVKHEPHFTMYSHPLSLDYISTKELSINIEDVITLASIISIALLLVVLISLSFPINERVSQSKALILMTGVNPLVYWFSSWIFDIVLLLLLSIPIYLASTYYYLFKGVNSEVLPEMPNLAVIVLYCLSVHTFLNFVSNFFKNYAVGFLTIFTVNLPLGIIAPLWSFMLVYVGYSESRLIKWFIGILFPPFNLLYSYLQIGHAVMLNDICIKNNPNGICDESKDYFDDNVLGVSASLILMSISFAYYLFLTVLVEVRWVEKIYAAIVLQKNQHLVRHSQKLEAGSSNNRDSLKATHVSKIYQNSPFEKPLLAVKNVNIEVKKGQCVGLLGCNGAGKTTLFKILTGYEFPTVGDCSVNGISLKDHKRNYLLHLGYCPQFDAIDFYMTGRQILELFCCLRGIRSDKIGAEVQIMLNMMGLNNHADKPSRGYSGGTKRKLSAAISLIAYRDFVLLDEPTTGVDPGARVMFHSVLEKMKSQGRSLLLSSHNLNECEKMSDQLAIMNKGRMLHNGTVGELKAMYANGYTLSVKFRSGQAPTVTPLGQDSVDSVDGPSISHLIPMTNHDASQMAIKTVKKKISREFDCVIRDKHSNVLQYHIKTTLLYANLFRKMETIRASCHDVVEMYTIADTTLEELFLNMQKADNDVDDISSFNRL